MGNCSFNTAWLKDEIYSKWLSMDRTNKHAALCRVCERVILLTTMGTKAVNSHMKSESRVDVFLHQKVTVRYPQQRDELWGVCEMIIIVSHGQTTFERGFSNNSIISYTRHSFSRRHESI